jgi:hypothetical protein
MGGLDAAIEAALAAPAAAAGTQFTSFTGTKEQILTAGARHAASRGWCLNIKYLLLIS